MSHSGNIKDHGSQVIIINHNKNLRSLKYCETYQNVTQRCRVSKRYWESGMDRLAWHRVATNLQFVKTILCLKHNKTKCNNQGLPIFHYHGRADTHLARICWIYVRRGIYSTYQILGTRSIYWYTGILRPQILGDSLIWRRCKREACSPS